MYIYKLEEQSKKPQKKASLSGTQHIKKKDIGQLKRFYHAGYNSAYIVIINVSVLLIPCDLLRCRRHLIRAVWLSSRVSDNGFAMMLQSKVSSFFEQGIFDINSSVCLNDIQAGDPCQALAVYIAARHITDDLFIGNQLKLHKGIEYLSLTGEQRRSKR